ncbi:hypothetical protein HMI54_012904 [Coelomomyces lativittatus]|nr:hypothetical protein HMI55_003164 [Coelomomyces lativittatus]KAJ1511316.1 hypothetical protein HMI56_005554 [Coelomomyces lativittatus]KAJ1515105.1 hypothetical protein HMI54_012904 [Coelomomyces lativittatus]
MVFQISPESFTDKCQLVIQQARDLARQSSHVQLHAVHVACALFNEDDNLIKNILSKTGCDPLTCERGFKHVLVSLPIQDPPPEDITAHPSFIKLIQTGMYIDENMKT